MKRALALVALSGLAACSSKDAPGLWRSNAPPLPVAGAGWAGGAAADGSLLAFHHAAWDSGEILVSDGPANQQDVAIGGGTIAWRDDRSGYPHIYVVELPGTTERMLDTPLDVSQYDPDADGDLVVYAQNDGGGQDIYVFNLVSGTSAQLSFAPTSETKARISGTRVCWEDNPAGLVRYDIVCASVTTGGAVSIADTGVQNKSAPALDGDLLVWQQFNGSSHDIQGWNFATGLPFTVAASSFDETAPDVDAQTGRVVYQADVGGHQDVLLYDIASNTTTRLTTNGAQQIRPKVSGDFVVWVDSRNGTDDLYGFDLSRGIEEPLRVSPAYEISLGIDGDDIVSGSNTDVVRLQRLSPPDGVGLYSLSSGSQWALLSEGGFPFSLSTPVLLDGAFFQCGAPGDGRALGCAAYSDSSGSWTLSTYEYATNPYATWTQVAAAASADSIVVIAANQSTQIAVRYTPSTGAWDPLATPAVNMQSSTLVAAGGGLVHLDFESKTFERFDAFENTWSAAGSYVSEAAAACPVLAAAGGELFYVAGADELRRLDLSSKAVDRRVSTIPTPRFNACPVSDGSRIYVLGGYSDGTLTEVVDAVDIFVP